MFGKHPCSKDCPRRSPICHGTCPDYATIDKARLERVNKSKGWDDAACMMLPNERARRFENARKAQARAKTEREVLYGK